MCLEDPVDLLATRDIGQVAPLIESVERRVLQEGIYAAGFISYEAAPAFNPCLQAQPSDARNPTPLSCFRLFRSRRMLSALPDPCCAGQVGDWTADMEYSEYATALDRIKRYIASGDTYQVNYTYRLRASMSGDALDYFLQLAADAEAPYSAFLDCGRYAICSFSPELLFSREGDTVTMRPMKGTAPRGVTLADDQAQISALQTSEKDRAENIMILDMVRNDVGQVARYGSVRASDLFAVERYPTVWQMTSTVHAELPCNASLSEVLKALFPCASVTGAPKRRTMEIIAELETSPRGVYTGSVGFLEPDGRAQFNVAIRTVVVDRQGENAEYGVGGGIVWDSRAEDEWAECSAKARVLDDHCDPFLLLETLLWIGEEQAFWLLDRHLLRIEQSAAYFGFRCEREAIVSALLTRMRPLDRGRHRVRLLLEKSGVLDVESSALDETASSTRRVCIAGHAVDSRDRFLYHKTTHRKIYDQILSEHPDCEYVILWNERGEITESCFGNVIAHAPDGQWITPPIASGLLAGTYRQELLEEARIVEGVMLREDIAQMREIRLINSVRGMMSVEW